jgi:AcrR family transcriptional regulator
MIILFVNNRMIVLFRNRCYSCQMTEALKRSAAKRRTNDPVGVRNRLINAAAQTFQANGFAATSMHDVRRTAGATGGALYHHFPTKKALALAVITERISTEVAATWIAAVREADDAATGILAVFDDVIASIDRNGSVYGCPLGNLAVELSLADADIMLAVLLPFSISPRSRISLTWSFHCFQAPWPLQRPNRALMRSKLVPTVYAGSCERKYNTSAKYNSTPKPALPLPPTFPLLRTGKQESTSFATLANRAASAESGQILPLFSCNRMARTGG